MEVNPIDNGDVCAVLGLSNSKQLGDERREAGNLIALENRIDTFFASSNLHLV